MKTGNALMNEGISAARARREWEEATARRDAQLLAFETPTPEGEKRCMTCWETMPIDVYCECLKAIGADIRRKAVQACAGLDRVKPRTTRKKIKNEQQGRLFQ